MKDFRLYLALCIVSVAAGCNSNCKDRGECECVTRFDCAEDLICVNGQCIENDPNPWLIPERSFGESCIANRECIDGVCLPMGPDNGGVCSKICDTEESCEEGWECRAWTGDPLDLSESAHVCVQKTAPRLCMACAVDGHCNATGDLCVELPDGHVCAQDCSINPCPTGYTCEFIERENGTFSQCIPLDESCECGPGKEGMGKACNNSNEFGVCSGWSFCTKVDSEYVWSDCDAQVPAMEICNGLDDDCDGLIDDKDPGLSHDELGDDGKLYPICYLGGCVGRWQCRTDEEDHYAWQCDAGDPEKEICNGADDNCDGEADEPFKNADGFYVHAQNCGTCGTSCDVLLSDLKRDENGDVVEGASECIVRNDTAVCVPLICEDGFYPYPHDNPISCIRLESPACEVCGADSDCHVYSDKCMTLEGDFGSHCLQSCDEDSPYHCTGLVNGQSCCPDGYTCKSYQGGKWCIPKGNSCTCDAEKVGMTRNCTASSDLAVCQGRQTCEKTGKDVFAWSQCSAEDLSKEVCDGQDNNCDGQVDEVFVDEQGRYNADEHCGECNNDCPSRWKAPELHATGACLLKGESYSCQFTGCKAEEIVAGKRCGDDNDCNINMKCDRQFHFCVAQSGDTPEVSCSSDADCLSLDYAYRCVSGSCKLHVQFHDINDIQSDGCECGEAINGGGDEPEIFNVYPNDLSSYIDRDCDGLDGTEATSLFVSSQSSQSLGTRENPYRTIAEAISAYDPSKHTAILVAAGTYIEQVILKSGVQLYGGYTSDFSGRNIVLNPTQIASPPPSSDDKPGSVYIPEVNRRTVVSGFVIIGYNADESMATVGAPGRNSYAVYVEQSSSQIVVVNNDIRAGRAGNGGRGESGESGYNGNDGNPGTNSRECSSTTCYGETTKGGAGGTNSYCSQANGRTGATARDGAQVQDFNGFGRDGLGGSNNSYEHSYAEHASLCKYDCLSGGYANGGDGMNGENGNSGSRGHGCSNHEGQLSGKIWVGYSGSAGGTGYAATGGGGGGAGGGAINTNDASCTTGNLLGDIGGSGGGGGAGGCGGTGGGAGGPGGGAFAIWIASTKSDASIYGNKIQLGVGGKGGNGGDGGAGGKGGRGGIGGQNLWPAWCAGYGGTGGGGGDGGAGGGGGAGCGGISIGIAGIINENIYLNANSFTYPEGGENSAAGLGGLGGDSPAGQEFFGEDGANGIAAFVHAF